MKRIRVLKPYPRFSKPVQLTWLRYSPWRKKTELNRRPFRAPSVFETATVPDDFIFHGGEQRSRTVTSYPIEPCSKRPPLLSGFTLHAGQTSFEEPVKGFGAATEGYYMTTEPGGEQRNRTPVLADPFAFKATPVPDRFTLQFDARSRNNGPGLSLAPLPTASRYLELEVIEFYSCL